MRAFHLSSLGAALLILIAFVALLMRLPAQAEHAAWGGHAGTRRWIRTSPGCVRG